jgi:hypothetical protein
MQQRAHNAARQRVVVDDQKTQEIEVDRAHASEGMILPLTPG